MKTHDSDKDRTVSDIIQKNNIALPQLSCKLAWLPVNSYQPPTQSLSWEYKTSRAWRDGTCRETISTAFYSLLGGNVERRRSQVDIISSVHATASRWPPQLAPCSWIFSHTHPSTTTISSMLSLHLPLGLPLTRFFILVSILMLSVPTWCCSFWLHILPTVFSCTTLCLLYLSPLF